ncbi:MAG: hypothetical protein LBH72_00065 [Proteiniphilum sp.]|jgi:hypothetical protein|nr:hypothetical protein [Proteiniphilum sp.]
MDDYLENCNGEIISRDAIPKDLWELLLYATMYDYEKIERIKRKIANDGKRLVAVYPGVPELMKGIDIAEMELVGSIMDGALYLK